MDTEGGEDGCAYEIGTDAQQEQRSSPSDKLVPFPAIESRSYSDKEKRKHRDRYHKQQSESSPEPERNGDHHR